MATLAYRDVGIDVWFLKDYDFNSKAYRHMAVYRRLRQKGAYLVLPALLLLLLV